MSNGYCLKYQRVQKKNFGTYDNEVCPKWIPCHGQIIYSIDSIVAEGTCDGQPRPEKPKCVELKELRLSQGRVERM